MQKYNVLYIFMYIYDAKVRGWLEISRAIQTYLCTSVAMKTILQQVCGFARYSFFEFGEFLDIILNKSGNQKASVITDFFKNLTQGRYKTNGLAFPNWVLKEQRGHLINAIKLEKND